MEQLKRIFYYFRVKSAVRQAKRLHKISNRRYYVLQLARKPMVLNRTQINRMVDSGVLAKSMRDFYTLQKYCIYITK